MYEIYEKRNRFGEVIGLLFVLALIIMAYRFFTVLERNDNVNPTKAVSFAPPVAQSAVIAPARMRFYTSNYVFEGAMVVVRDRNHRTARAQFPATFQKDRW